MVMSTAVVVLSSAMMADAPHALTSGIEQEFDSGSDLSAFSGSWQWPSAQRQIIRHYLAPSQIRDPKHRGIDIAAAEGSELLSPAAGTVRFSGIVANRPVLTIDHGAGIVSTFDPILTELTAGDYVERGQTLGVAPAREQHQHCAVSCYHLGARYQGRYINPLFLLGELKRSVLYPLPSPIVLN